MRPKSWQSKYKILIWSIVLVPNIFAVAFGVASFPYTCAPMFAHQVNEDSKLCVFKFEGSNERETVDLINYYGRSETFFIRYFFSKVYGSSEAISPFDTKLSESREDFQKRMDVFFEDYAVYLAKEKQLSLDRITLKIKQVDKFRNDISSYETIGYYDIKLKKYVCCFEGFENPS